MTLTDHAPRRVASLQPSATVILASVDRLNHVVACTKYCVDVCPEIAARNVIIVNDSWTANTDQILAAQPDLVIATVPYQEKAVTEILKSGVRFLGLAPKTLADIYTDIATISGVVGATEEGNAVIREMQDKIEEVRRLTRHARRPRVYCEEWGKPLIGSQPWVAELVEAVGGEFIGAPGAQTSAEATAAANPEVVVAAWCGAGDRVPLQKLVNDRKWDRVAAVQSGNVFCIRDEFLNTPAPTLIRGLHALAAAIHPELFPHADGLRCISEVPASSAAH